MPIERLPQLWSIQTKNYCFGAAAFRAWADDIESGKYEAMDPAGFEANKWYVYTNYVCVMASNGSGYREFLDKALALNPDMAFFAPHGANCFSAWAKSGRAKKTLRANSSSKTAWKRWAADLASHWKP